MLGYFGTLTFYKYLAIQKKRCFKREEVLSVPVFQVLWNRLQTFKPGPLNMVKITNTDTFSYWKVSWVSWVLFNKEFEINVFLLHLSNPSWQTIKFYRGKELNTGSGLRVWLSSQVDVWSLWSPKTPLVGWWNWIFALLKLLLEHQNQVDICGLWGNCVRDCKYFRTVNRPKLYLFSDLVHEQIPAKMPRFQLTFKFSQC